MAINRITGGSHGFRLPNGGFPLKSSTQLIAQDVVLTCLQTDKFKTSCLSINLLTSLNRESAALNALVPKVLRRGTVSLPDMAAISNRLDSLYGARISPVVRKKGEVQVIGFFADFADDAFLPGKNQNLEDTAALMGDILLHPAANAGVLREDYVESEKEKLLQKLRGRINDKRAYALQRLLEQMFSMEDYGTDPLGSEQSIENIGTVQLSSHYRQLLQSSPVEIFYCGSAAPERVVSALKPLLSVLPRSDDDSLDIGTDIRMNALEEAPRYFEDSLAVAQGKLSMGFRLGDCMEEPDTAAIKVFNAVFGGCVTSKLFMNVREKLSLCYYASSAVDLHKGVMIVSSGIEFDKFEAAKSEILSQLEAVKRGDFTPEELEAAKLSIAGDYRSLTDSPAALESFYLDLALIGPELSPLELAEAAEQVTKEQVVQIAKGVELDAVYFLRGEEQN